MNILVLQHVSGDTGGSFLRFLPAGGASLTIVNFERGDSLPALEPFDAMLVLGGPMDVWDVDLHPWMIGEKRAIRRFVREMGRPYLGLCLGHQMLADALGGTCGPQKPKQVGPFVIELTAEGLAHPLFAGFEPMFKAYKWHGVHVAQMPDGAHRLAVSAQCRCEAMAAAPRAFGVQFHPEFQQDTHDSWLTIPGSPESYIEHFGPDGVAAARLGALPHLPVYEGNAAMLVRNFLDIARG